MKTAPIFFPVSAQPELEPGLSLSASASGELLHGSLARWMPREPAEPLLAALDFAAITEGNQRVALGKLIHGRMVTPPAWELVTVGEHALGWVAFTISAAQLFGSELPLETLHVHAMLGDELSAPVVLRPSQPKPRETGPLPGDQLLCAYHRAAAGKFVEAVQLFEKVLEVPAVAGDLDGAHRYNAACAAALSKDETRARRWLAEDDAARAAAHSRTARAALIAGAPPAEEAALDALLREHVLFRRADPDLASLRAKGGAR